ncbi:MAG: tryptophan 7-halogenase [Chthoniobacter sp.]
MTRSHSSSSSTQRPPRIAIAGNGPSGSTLAALLADKGADVTMFNGGKRPAMIVGESGIPVLVPLMRRLGIEEEVAAVAQYKPGATFALGPSDPIPLSFQSVDGILPTYAYNLPRPQFDQSSKTGPAAASFAGLNRKPV